MSKLRRGDLVTLRGDWGFVGIVQGTKKDKCGQIPVWWLLWHGQKHCRSIWCEPYKLERVKAPPIKSKVI